MEEKTTMEELRAVEIYIGTSIRGPGRGIGRTMYLMRCKKADGSDYESSPEIAQFEDATENRLVLYALRDALQRLNYACSVTVHTECRYVANAIDQHWPEAWQENHWTNSRGKEVADSLLWADILQEIEESGHQLKAEEGRHEYSEWMRWNIPLKNALNNVFLKVKEN